MIQKTLMATITLACVTAAFAQPPVPVFVPAASTTTTSTTTPPTPQPMPLPPFGLGSTEVARIDLLNAAAASSSGTAASCTGTVAFYNASGTLIGSSTSYTLGTNQISSVSLSFGSAGLTSPRGEITAMITPTVPSSSSSSSSTSSSTTAAPCQLLATLSTYDQVSGATHLFTPVGGPGGPGGPGGFPAPPQQ